MTCHTLSVYLTSQVGHCEKTRKRRWGINQTNGQGLWFHTAALQFGRLSCCTFLMTSGCRSGNLVIWSQSKVDSLQNTHCGHLFASCFFLINQGLHQPVHSKIRNLECEGFFFFLSVQTATKSALSHIGKQAGRLFLFPHAGCP